MARVTLRQPGFVVILLFVLIMQVIEPSRVWTILLTGFGGMFVTAYLWTRSLSRNIQLRRESNLGWVQVGGQIEERLTLSNNAFVPAPRMQYIDRSTLPDFHASRSGGLDAEYFDQWTVTATCQQRGMFYLGDAELQATDPFGIFHVTIQFPQRSSILVLPQIATLPELSIGPAGSLGDQRPRRNSLEQTIHASSVREYAHGDSTRLIHWPTTARTNKVFVRLLESAPEGDWCILLDLDQNTMRGKGWDSVEEQSVALAASLADRGLRLRKSVGLICNGRELTWLAPKKGADQKWQIMQSLAVARPASLKLSTVLERAQASLHKQQSLIIITASTQPEWLKTVIPLARRGITPTLMMMDASKLGSDGSEEATASILRQRNITCHVIPCGSIEPPKVQPEVRGKWKWQTLPTGEVMLVQE